MNQEDMIKKIRQSADHVPVPENLSPEQIGKKLKKNTHHSAVWKYGAAAAVCVIALSVWWNGSLSVQPEVILPADRSALMAEVAETAEEPVTVNGGETAKVSRGKSEKENSAEDYSQVYDTIYPYIQPDSRVAYNVPAGAMAGAPVKEEAGAGSVLQGSETQEKQIYVENESSFDSAPTANPVPEISQTNVQVEGVDEGDIVKTDGSCIYAAGEYGSGIRLISVEGGAMRAAETIETKGTVREFYIDGNFLSVISEVSVDETEPVSQSSDMSGCGIVTQRYQTLAETYDISHKEKPRLVGSVTQDGAYQSSRLRDGYLYLFTSYYPQMMAKKAEPETYIPLINEVMIPFDRMFLPDNVSERDMLVISAIDLKNPKKPSDMAAIVTGSDIFYVSGENIYVGSHAYDSEAHQNNYTELLKFTYKEGRVAYQTKANLDGWLNNQFSLDEYNGYLRVVSTLEHREGKETNSLSIYDKDLKLTGSIEDLAPGEQIYSARFIGETAYFVTYRNMDPLFAADVSNPESPKILSELKITGFSEYLHPFSKGLLLGIGQETNPETGNFEGLKLSMFDISDPVKVTEKDKMVSAAFEYSPAWYNHKAVLISEKKNLIGFGVNAYDKITREWDSRYLVYTYQPGKGFTQVLNHGAGEGNIDSVRGLYIDNLLYILEEDGITSYSLEDFSQQNQLKY